MKKFFEILLYIILAVLAAGVLLAVFLTVSEYRPADVENVPVTGTPADRQIALDQEITLISWNLGYGALGKDADFVMDGGGNAPAADKALVEANLAGIADTLKKSFPEDSLIARIGGDEFISFSLDVDEDSAENIKKLLDSNSAKVNETVNKPYFIEFSYGFTEFICNTTVKLEEVMMKADEELYVNKRYKRKNVCR